MATVADAAETPLALGPEVSDSELTLIESVQQGIVEEPPLMAWNAWQRWRSGAGRRPPTPREPEQRPAFVRREAALWRQLMEAVHGVNWRDALDQQETEEAARAPVVEPVAAEGALVPAPVPVQQAEAGDAAGAESGTAPAESSAGLSAGS